MADEGGNAETSAQTEPIPEGESTEPQAQAAPPGRPRWRTPVLIALGVILVGGIGFAVAVLSLGGGDAGSGGPGTVEGDPLPPGNLTAEAGRFEVTLTWTTPDTPLEGYRVYRDAELRETLPAHLTSYIDEAVSDKTYEYEVEAYQGSRTSEPASITVRTEVAPLKLARLEGTFRVTTKVVSQSGYTNYNASRMSWRFRPTCAEGACDTIWRAMFFKDLRTALNRAGLNYRGEDSGKFNVSCGESESVSDVKVNIKVVKARAVLGEWRVAKFVGTFTHTETSQGGCVTSSATLSIRGKLASL